MSFQTLLDKVHGYNPHLDDALVTRVFEFAQKAHEGQRQKNGEPYIHHPLGTAMVLTDLKVDQATICAALLHDVLHRASVTIEEVEKAFGEEIAAIVRGSEQLLKIRYTENMTEHQIDLLQKLVIAMTKDIRSLLIKLASRLQHMRSLEHVGGESREWMAKETREVYVYLADLLGIWRIKWQLEDLSFKYLQPEDFTRIAQYFSSMAKIRNKYITQIQRVVLKRTEKDAIPCEITGRFKHYYAIYLKMKEKKKEFDEIYDVFALRVVVDTIPQCYQVLGIIHSLFPPVAGRVKDYIAAPKPNGYQSLHTTVYGIKGHPLEFQIRTHEMHEEALYGVAAHWYYKHRYHRKLSALQWIKAVFDIRKRSGTDNVPKSWVMNVFKDRIFVFTSHRDIIELPKDSTPIDFAYAIHTTLGHRCVAAIVNNKEVLLSTKLETGDTVQIITADYENVNQEWLSYVKSATAKHAIQSWLHNNAVDPMTRKGKSLLQTNIQRYVFQSLPRVLPRLMKIYPEYKESDTLYRAVGEGKLSLLSLLVKLCGEEALLFSPTKMLRGEKLNNGGKAYVTLLVQVPDNREVLAEIADVLAKHRIIPEMATKHISTNMNRIQIILVIRVSAFKELFDLCNAIDAIPEVEVITKQ